MKTDGRTVTIVTGGGGGLGIAIARRLAKRGDAIVLWDIHPEIEQLAKEFEGSLGIRVDVTDPSSVDQALARTISTYGGVSVLVNSAGIVGPTLPVVDYSFDDWKRVIAINLDGTFLCCRAVIPVMVRAGRGQIVNISSVAGKEGNPNAAAYSASKAAVIALTKSLGKELANTEIRVNCVTPAAIDSELFRQSSPEFATFVKSKIPLGRLGRPDEVAALVEWLASPDCSFSTGATFDISGGRATY